MARRSTSLLLLAGLLLAACGSDGSADGATLYDSAEDGPIDPDQPSRAGFGDFLDQSYADEPWKPLVSAVSVQGRSSYFLIDLRTDDVGDADLLAACEAASQYAARFEPAEDAITQVAVEHDLAVLAIGTLGEPCELL